MVDDDISDSLNDMIAKNKKGKPIIMSANETMKSNEPPEQKIPKQPTVSYEEQDRENREYSIRLKEAKNIQEYQAIQKERTDKRLARLKKVPSRPAEEQYQKEKQQVQETQQQESVIPSALKQQPTTSITPSVDEENQTKFGIKYVKPKDRQAGKDYVWIPTANEYAEYQPDRKIEIENALTQKKEVVTMEQLKYLYSPSAVGFVKERKSAKYTTELKPVERDGNYVLDKLTQLHVMAKVKIHGNVYTMSGYSYVSKGNLNINEAKKEAIQHVKSKVVRAVDLIRSGYSDDDAVGIAKESGGTEPLAETELPYDVEIESEPEEEQINYVTSG